MGIIVEMEQITKKNIKRLLSISVTKNKTYNLQVKERKKQGAHDALLDDSGQPLIVNIHP